MIHHLRKNSKIILAILGVILMLSWLVVPTLTGLMQSSAVKAHDPVAVTWKGGQLTQGELQRLKIVHSTVVRFLNQIMQEVQQSGGVSRAPGHSQPWDLGVYADISDGSIVETMILAQRAKELGVKVSDETVKNFLLTNVGDHKTVTEDDLVKFAKEASPDSRMPVSQGAIFEHLKTQILAQQMRLLLQAGVDSMSPGDLSGMPSGALPPSEMWNIYEKLNRQVQIEAYPVKVADYVSKVTKEPTEAELKKLFEEGRRTQPTPMTSEPAFHQPYRAAFEYVDLDFAPFLEAAKKDITEEQIAAEYEKGKAAGKFKAEEPAPMTPELKPEDKPGEEKKPGEEPKPGEEKKPEEKKPDDKPANPDNTKPKEAAPEPKATPDKKDGSALIGNAQFVNFQADDSKKKADKPAEAKPADAKPAETKPAETKPAEAKPAANPAETKPGETKPVDPAAKPETKPADPANPDAKPAEDKPAEPKAEPKEVKFKTLDEVREEIRTQLAQEPATKKRNELTTKILAAVNDYGRKFSRWKAADDRANEAAKEAKKERNPPKPAKSTIEKPAPLDFAKILEGSGAKLQQVPLVSPFEVQEQVDDPKADGAVKKKPKYSIATAFRFDGQNFQSFPEFAFDPSMPLYAADTLPFPREGSSPFMGGGGLHVWIYWRTDVQPAKEPDFATAKKDVEAYWKKREAYQFAESEAKKLAEQAADGKELKSIVPNAKDVITPAGFTWLTSGSLSGQFGRPMPSRVEGIDFIGEDFREAVFGLDVGESGIAPDQPKSTIWVVRLISQEGDLNRDRFLEKTQDQDFIVAAMLEDQRLKQGLYSDLFKHFDVKFIPRENEREE